MPTITQSIATQSILVTGDAGTDLDTYLHFDGPNPPANAMPTRIHQRLGGSGIAYGILREWAGDAAEKRLGFLPPTEVASPVFAVWRLIPFDGKAKPVWRLTHSTNPGTLAGDEPLCLLDPKMPPSALEPFGQDIILIHDDAATFRHARGETRPVETAWSRPESFVIWKMSPPFCRGDLWWNAVAAGVPERTAVVLTLGDLRSAPVRISCGISWERTALDIARELEINPALSDLRTAAHVVVTIHGEGAVWRRNVNGKGEFTLFFDAAHMEKESQGSDCATPHAYGFTSTFAAALAAACAAGEGEASDCLRQGIVNGLHAMRLLHVKAHGPDDGEPGFPAKEIAAILRDSKAGKTAEPTVAFSDYSVVEIPVREVASLDSKWRIAQSRGDSHADEPLYGLARRVAVFGVGQLRGIPHARFGKLLTADRDEIEALRNLKTLIEAYVANPKDKKPLSLAVFGPPGAGKSYGVKQIAKQVLGKECPILEFNLSQFSEADLIGALHRVRDEVLRNEMPVVFWDEFDSSQYKWLQLLLAPMNDGQFQEGQIIHPIGRCVFVFAGATSHSMEQFGPTETKDLSDKTATERWNQFKLLKGPDFISRIHGALNVLGPNPRGDAPEGRDHEPEGGQDVSFPLRRAILLRSLLGLDPDQRLNIDPDLLTAMLEVAEYTNGARSFEKICDALKAASGKQATILPSHLPADAVLQMCVKDLNEFKSLLTRDQTFQHQAAQLAPAVHRCYQLLAEPENPNAEPFEKLSEESKADNYAAALRIPWLLGLAGLHIADSSATGALTSEQVLEILNEPRLLEVLAEEEHDQWMLEKRNNGWVFGKIDRDDENDKKEKRIRHIHDLLIPYADLDEKQQEKDRSNVRNIPRIVELAELSIVGKKPVAGE